MTPTCHNTEPQFSAGTSEPVKIEHPAVIRYVDGDGLVRELVHIRKAWLPGFLVGTEASGTEVVIYEHQLENFKPRQLEGLCKDPQLQVFEKRTSEAAHNAKLEEARINQE